MGLVIVAAAFEHLTTLQEKTQIASYLDPEPVIKELLKAHYCLASLRVIQALQSSELRNAYGALVLQFLCRYPDEELEIVRETFTDQTGLDSAVRRYIHNQISDSDRERMEILEGKSAPHGGLSLLCMALHVRIAGALYPKPEFVEIYIQNVGAVLAAWKVFYGNVIPVVDSSEEACDPSDIILS
jgi:hypothetical protein